MCFSDSRWRRGVAAIHLNVHCARERSILPGISVVTNSRMPPEKQQELRSVSPPKTGHNNSGVFHAKIEK